MCNFVAFGSFSTFKGIPWINFKGFFCDWLHENQPANTHLSSAKMYVEDRKEITYRMFCLDDVIYGEFARSSRGSFRKQFFVIKI